MRSRRQTTVLSRKPAMSDLMPFERRVIWGAVLAVAPACLFALGLVLLLRPPLIVVLLSLLMLGCTALLLRWHLSRFVPSIRTLAALLDALREGDYSLRARGGVTRIYDVNALAEAMQAERHRHEETSRILSKTLEALDSAVLAFNGDGKLLLFNPAARHLLDINRTDAGAATIKSLGLQDLLFVPSGDLITHAFAGRSGRFEIRHSTLRHEGRSARLLVINQIDRVLRQEERMAWQRLLRVLGHELNNSLAPIRSMSDTLRAMVMMDPRPADLFDDLESGLEVMGSRAAALTRFLSGYSRLARLPPPNIEAFELGELIMKVARLEQRKSIIVEPGAARRVHADRDQIEQAVINLIRNAVEASPDHGAVTVRWQVASSLAVIEVEDEGPGPPSSENLFVPFFTTKPGGSGIGLALVRQIAEAHEGDISLTARADREGAIARLTFSSRDVAPA